MVNLGVLGLSITHKTDKVGFERKGPSSSLRLCNVSKTKMYFFAE